MEENTIIEDIQIDESIEENSSDSAPTDNDSAELARALLEELRQEVETEDVSQGEEEETSETPTTIDYSEQLSDIYSAVVGLRSDIDILNTTVLDIQSTVESQPDDIRSAFDDISQFQYLVFSLYFGVLVALLFIMGLKK